MGSDEHHPCCAASYDQRKQREYPVYLKLSLLFLSFVFYFLITKGIINIGSDAGRIGEFQESVYSAAKAGVIAFSKVPIYFSSYATLASFSIVLFTPFADISQRSRETQHSTECHMSCIDRTKKGRYGREQHVERFAGNSFISLFFLALSLLPSFFSHRQQSRFTDEVLERAKKMYPLRRLGTPEDIMYAVMFFASDASSFITGQTLSVNGGYPLIFLFPFLQCPPSPSPLIQ